MSLKRDEVRFAAPIYWIGGSPCAGKSTIAEALAARFDLPVYRCDDAYYQHQHLVTADREPIFTRLISGTCDDVWMRPVSTQVEEELGLYREEFRFIVDDLLACIANGPVIAEGAALLPDLLDSIGVPVDRSIWIVPTYEFQHAHYSQREWRHDVVSTCSNPEEAWNNWMDRDAGFARAVATDAQARGRRVIVVDGSRSITDTIDDVATWFGLSTTTITPHSTRQ